MCFVLELRRMEKKSVNILGIDTCGGATTVWLLDGDTATDKITIPFDKSNKEVVLNNSVREILARNKTSFENLSAYAVITGPGSWTGSRIGVAATLAYHLAHPKPIIELKGNFSPSEVIKRYNEKKFISANELQPHYDSDFVVTVKNQ